jgi:spore maturation protein SpmB
VIALRAASGSHDPAGIVPTTLFATLCSTAVAIAMAKICQRWWPISNPGPTGESFSSSTVARTADDMSSAEEPRGAQPGALDDPVREYPTWASMLALFLIVLLIPVTVIWGRSVAPWIIPGLVAGLLLFGAVRRVHVYEAFVDGARDGFQVAVRIIPYLVAILVAVGMLRASGALDLLIGPLGAATSQIGLPAEALLMGLLRPLSGSGAFAFLASVLNDPMIGPDSYTGYLVSTIQGSTETTFYVLAVYFGAVGIRRMRHAVVVGLTADAAGVAASVLICSILYGG